MLLSKLISRLMQTTGLLKGIIDDLGRVVLKNKSGVIQNLNMAVLYLNRAIEALRNERDQD